jgi:hypothetical protein
MKRHGTRSLNGAHEKHTMELSYRKSRGLIVLDIIGNVSPRDFEYNWMDNEPFTIVLFQERSFSARWNGAKRSNKLDTEKSIFSLPCSMKSERTFQFI